MSDEPSSGHEPPSRAPSTVFAQRALAAVAAVVFVAVGAHTCATWLSAPGRNDRIALELADEAALDTLSDWAGLPVLRTGTYRQQSSEDRDTGERAPIALWRRGNRDMNHFVCASADADPPRDQTVFVVDQEQCAEPYVRGYVLSRFVGAGRLARLWMTAASFRQKPPDREVLRIYVDDRREPVVEAALSRVLDGTAGEMFARPFGAGSFRRMAWYYPVVFANKLIVSIDHLDSRDLYFHQTGVVLDEKQRVRRAPRRRLTGRDDVLHLLRSSEPMKGTARTKRVSLGPDDTVETHQLTGPATIVEARTRVAREALDKLARVTLQARWDDAADPAIDLPLSVLYGATAAPPADPSLDLGGTREGNDVILSLRLPMPFASQARWSLTNEGTEPVELELELRAVDGVPTQPWGYLTAQHFGTDWPRHTHHPMVLATGPGRLVGVCMAMTGHGMGSGGHPFNFLEGDEVGIVDGTLALPGTGTEDYFNGAFYFEDGPGATPFAQVWNILRKVPGAPGQAHVSTCRWHVLGDAIDFADSLDLSMEIGPGLPSLLDRFDSVAFLYLAPGGHRGLR
ncbi:MAG: DUF2961 domain-containing protein [Deltaproteobacteria bacterium]|nr:DUF2961 domain-containing protein [Deltaproteobacteria bacterium]